MGKQQFNFNERQQLAFDTLVDGRNVFLTGDAGTGKSYVLQNYLKHCKKNGLDVLVTAPTGIAALNIDGVTLHRAFKAPIGPIIQPLKSVSSLLKNADAVVIDEISMCRRDLFEFVIGQIMYANKIRRKNGIKDIQIIVTGDFFQLPPVIVGEERMVLTEHYGEDIGYGFAFQSPMWKACNFVCILLNEVVRQSDKEAIDNLNGVRRGKINCLSYFTRHAAKSEIENAILLCGTNKAVKEKNELELNNIQEKEIQYNAIIEGEVKDSDKMTDDVLRLKVGARVMTIINDMEDRFRNGSFGTILDLGENKIIVEMDDGQTVELERYRWSIKGYSLKEVVNDNGEKKNKLEIDEIGSFEQFPLKLAYAITIHKSQGQTYDAVNLNPYCWDCGQLYVALSRVKDVHKLYITKPLLSKYLVTSLEVVAFYKANNLL